MRSTGYRLNRIRCQRHRAACGLLVVTLALAGGTGCSLKRIAVGMIGNALAEGGSSTYAADDDPELVAQALPFGLKLIESLLAQAPEHRGLLLAATSGFTQYTYAFVQLEADEVQDQDPTRALHLRERARNLYLRARDYGIRGLETRHRGFGSALREQPAERSAVR